MINLLVVGLWLTFLICVVGVILYSKVKKVPEKVISTLSGKLEAVLQQDMYIELSGKSVAEMYKEAKDYKEKHENTLEFLNLADKQIEELEEEAKKLRATLVKQDDQLESLYLINLDLKELVENEQSYVAVLRDRLKQYEISTLEEEWRELPPKEDRKTTMQLFISNLGRLKTVNKAGTSIASFSLGYKNSITNGWTLPQAIAHCFLPLAPEGYFILIIDESKPTTANNLVWLDRAEMMFLKHKSQSFGVTKANFPEKEQTYFQARYRGERYGSYSTEVEAQKVVYEARKQWLIENNREEWLDLWKPDFITENN
jgi:hypothetical protein